MPDTGASDALCRSGARRQRLGRGSGRARTTVPGAAALQAAAAVRNCHDLPRTATGTVQRNKLREQLRRE